MSENKHIDKRVSEEAQQILRSHNYKNVPLKIEEIKSKGKVSILPLLLDLLSGDAPDNIKQDVIMLIADLKKQECSSIVAEYIEKRSVGNYLSSLIASCWQSSLDYSNYLKIFTDCFITENYQTALESFTVIEEMLWRTNPDMIDSCRQMLINRSKEIASQKLLLYNELVKLLKLKRTASKEDFPDLFTN
jgi:hypothetical protein